MKSDLVITLFTTNLNCVVQAIAVSLPHQSINQSISIAAATTIKTITLEQLNKTLTKQRRGSTAGTDNV